MKPILINNLDVAKNHEKISGEILIESCERLAEAISHDNESAAIRYELTGVSTKFHLPSLRLTLDANLPLICQRCLEPMQLKLSRIYDYVISESEPASIEGDDDIDWLEPSREMSVNALIEDELLMAIPFAPAHAHDCKLLKQESGEKHNPFAALKDLIK